MMKPRAAAPLLRTRRIRNPASTASAAPGRISTARGAPSRSVGGPGDTAPPLPGPDAGRSRIGAFTELVRLPAALSVLGDSLAGAAAAGFPLGRRTWAMPAASACLYWAGMALNDYADRALDAVERPERPIPSGRIRPGEALAAATALSGAGIGIAALAGGRKGAATAALLTAGVWGYDLALKPTPLGPLAMAYNRCMDVLLGSGGQVRAAAPPALGIALHTFGVTLLSRGEVHGTDKATSRVVLAGTAACTALPFRAPLVDGPIDRTATGVFAAWYASSVGRPQAAASQTLDADAVRKATGSGIRGMIPLQAAYISRAGCTGTAAALAFSAPAASAAFKAVSPT